MKYVCLLFGWFLVLQHGNASWAIPTPYSSFDECKKAWKISRYQYDHSTSDDNMNPFAWNCIPDQDALGDM